MINLKNIFFPDKWEMDDKFFVPKSVQESIPIKRIYKDGIFEVGGKFSKTFRFFDINYKVASPEDQTEMFIRYCAVLNSLESDAETKISIYNRNLNKKNFEDSILMPMKADRLDNYRTEYNTMLLDKKEESNNIIQEKYITISVRKKNIDQARSFFNRVEGELKTVFGKLASGIRGLTINDRLRIFHDFFRGNEEQYFDFDLRKTMQKGHDFKDYICPDSIEFKNRYFTIGEQYGRVLFLKEYANFVSDEMITELTDLPCRMFLSIDILPISTGEAVKQMHNRILAVETDIARWQNKQNMNNNFSAAIPYEKEQMRKQVKEFLDDLTTRDQRMMLTLVTIVHLADSYEQLEADTETLCSIGRGKSMCEFSTLAYQQEDGLNTALPYGLRKIQALRTMTTESTAVLMPFKTQEIQDTGGVYYGVNAISHNLIICNRKYLLNGNGFILGVSGSGKSMAAKQEFVSLALSTNDDIIVIDPEREVRQEAA